MAARLRAVILQSDSADEFAIIASSVADTSKAQKDFDRGELGRRPQAWLDRKDER